MGRVDGPSRDNDRPAGVAIIFQVSKHSVEPMLSNRCRNLLSHDDRGPTSKDELGKNRPEVALIGTTLALAGCREGLAWTGSSPKRSVIWPSSNASCEGPPSDPCEEVALRIGFEIVRSDIKNTPFIHIARRDVTVRDERP